MRTRFTRAVARAEITTGILVIVLGVALAAAILLWPAEKLNPPPLSPPMMLIARVAVAGAAVVAGVAVGAPFIVFGQLMLVFLDMRRRLARIDRRLRRWEVSAERRPESPMIERLRPR